MGRTLTRIPPVLGKQQTTPNTIVLGDFNLDWAKRHCQIYALKNFFNDMDDRIGNLNLIQIECVSETLE